MSDSLAAKPTEAAQGGASPLAARYGGRESSPPPAIP